MIYLVRDIAGGSVKIGLSDNPWARFSKIQSDHPGTLALWAVMDGNREDEAALHERFRASHIRGEWFVFTGAVEAWAEEERLAGRAKVQPVRKPRGQYQGDIAKALGISSCYVSMLLSGKRRGTLDLAVRLFNLAGARTSLLAEATDDEIATLTRFFDRTAA